MAMTGHKCINCGFSVKDCDAYLKEWGKPCCGTCHITDTHGLLEKKMPDPKPYEPGEPWKLYRLGDLPRDWIVHVWTRPTDNPNDIILARPPDPPEPELIAVMLPREKVEMYAESCLDGVLPAACRAALAASPVSEREQP